MGSRKRKTQVKVFCRIKPASDDDETCVHYLNETSLSIRNSRNTFPKSIHNFSRVFMPDVGTSEVFAACLLPYLKSVLAGENVLFFNYGVTGSGKTHTMQGSMNEPGLIPRTLDVIFNSIATYSTLKYVVKPNGHNGFDLQTEAEAIMDRQRLDYTSRPRTPYKSDLSVPCLEGRNVDPTTVSISQKHLYAVFVTFVELYNDAIFDLLDMSGACAGRSLNLYEDDSRNAYVHGVTEIEVKSANEALTAYYQGQKRRRVGATALNRESSRSHGIFTIRIVRTAYDTTYDEVVMDKNLLFMSQLCLVDLAGSERTNRSGTTGERLKEAATINKSLLTLRKCVEVLRMNQSAQACQNPPMQQQVVPYRESKLTRLFKCFFDGCGQVAILVCVHSTTSEYPETAHVLQFAERSQQVSTIPSTIARIGAYPMRHPSSSALLVSSEELTASSSKIQALDISLLDAVSVITSSSADSSPSDFCGCSGPIENRPDKSKKARKSFLWLKQHSSKCPFFSVLQARINERERIRCVMDNFSMGLESSLSELIRRASSRGSYFALLNKIDKLNAQKLQMGSKIRYLEDQVSRRRTVASPEHSQGTHKMSGSKVKKNGSKDRSDSFRTADRFPQSKRDFHEPVSFASLSSDSTIGERHNLKRRFRKSGGGPSSAMSQSHVATLSRQWETRLAGQNKQQKTVVPLHDTSFNSGFGNDFLNRPPPMNPRHRRSKSVCCEQGIWLEHKENHPVPLGTIFSPTGVKVRKSVTQVELNDTRGATNYLLHHQTATLEGNVETKLYKGSIIPTAGGGSAVIFNDVEHLQQVSPTRTNLEHGLSAPTVDTNDGDTQREEWQHQNEPIAKHRRLSMISTTSGISSATVRTEDEKSQASYRTITPPFKSEPSRPKDRVSGLTGCPR